MFALRAPPSGSSLLALVRLSLLSPSLSLPSCPAEKKVLPIATKITDMWTSTDFFKSLVRKVFTKADLDGNGQISETELYVCILRVYDEVCVPHWRALRDLPDLTFDDRVLFPLRRSTSGSRRT